jgi:spore coat polysaccharide biosynthesis protein SpsF
MKTIIISQARMTSSRLPGKVMMEVLDRPLLQYHVERLQKAKLADDVIVATTINYTDDPIVYFCKKLNIKYYRGSEENVLSRYYEAAKLYKADNVIRVTSDCPIIDPEIVDKTIQYYLNNNYDYVSNCTINRKYPRGMDTEIFSFNALSQAYKKAKKESELEHVTTYMWKNPQIFKLGSVVNEVDESKHRWTVDTLDDFMLIRLIIKNLYPINNEFNIQDCLELMRNNPDWMKINQDVVQKV